MVKSPLISTSEGAVLNSPRFCPPSYKQSRAVMRMRWRAAIAIACALLVCAALLLWWEYRRRPAEHINVLRARAAQGDPKAQFGLASAYYRGKGVPQDYAEALR